mmetsp:Transcript_39075/g.91493  ORF Transcript_39075/g.91493 Transcript_39075/m.91493 type:complete len:337 (-) Transcript_39075:1044-2054(-)
MGTLCFLEAALGRGDVRRGFCQPLRVESLWQGCQHLLDGDVVGAVRLAPETPLLNGLFPTGSDGLPLGALIVRFAARLGQLQGPHFFQQCRVLLLGAQQIGLAPGQCAKGGLPARCGDDTALGASERVRGDLPLRRLPLERLDLAKQLRPFFRISVDLATRRWPQGGGLACVAQQLAASLQRQATAGYRSGKTKAAVEFLRSQRGLAGCLFDGAKPLLCVAQRIACPSGLFDHSARLRQARLPCDGYASGERQSALRAGDMSRIRHKRGTAAQPDLPCLALRLGASHSLGDTPVQPLGALAQVVLLPLPFSLGSLQVRRSKAQAVFQPCALLTGGG